MLSAFFKRDLLSAGKVLFVGSLTAWCIQCDLPMGDDALPPTDVAGLERDAVLQLLAPLDVRLVGTVIPITVDATFPKDAGDDVRYCVRLAGAPGTLTFPFGDRCGPLRSEEPSVGGAGGSDDGGAGAATAQADALLHITQSCIAPTARWNGKVTGTLHAAYFPSGEETTASLFGVLYDNATCSGEPIVSTAKLLHLREPAADDEAEGGGDSGGANGAAGSKPTDGGSSTGGVGGGDGGNNGASAGGGAGGGGSGGLGGTPTAGGEPAAAGQGGG